MLVHLNSNLKKQTVSRRYKGLCYDYLDILHLFSVCMGRDSIANAMHVSLGHCSYYGFRREDSAHNLK